MKSVNKVDDASGLKATLRLVVWDIDDDQVLFIRDMKEQDVYLGEMPLIYTC